MKLFRMLISKLSIMGLLIGSLLMLVTVPSWAQNTQEPLTLSGKANFRWFGIKVYDIALYFKQDKQPFDLNSTRPLSLKITYDMDIDPADLIENTSEQWQEIAIGQSQECANQTQWLNQIKSIWPNINSGDSLTLTINAQQISTFYYNDKEVGRVEDTNFGYCFVAIWLAKDTTEPKIRKKLLKGATKQRS
jgi:hypothetical protein